MEDKHLHVPAKSGNVDDMTKLAHELRELAQELLAAPYATPLTEDERQVKLAQVCRGLGRWRHYTGGVKR